MQAKPVQFLDHETNPIVVLDYLDLQDSEVILCQKKSPSFCNHKKFVFKTNHLDFLEISNQLCPKIGISKPLIFLRTNFERLTKRSDSDLWIHQRKIGSSG